MKLFDIIFGRTIDRRIAAYQNDLVTRHCDEVQNIYRQMRGWRHDYHNHIQTMKALVSGIKEKAGREAAPYIDRLDDYLTGLNDDLTSVDTVVKTGNVMTDAILNSKLSLIKSKQIEVSAKATVPEKLAVSEIDLCVIIGNLLDNAMEACDNVQFTMHNSQLTTGEHKPWIRVYIGVLKGQLYISVSNSACGEVKKSGRTYLSTKNERYSGTETQHGFGLMRVDRIADKYSGYVNRQNEEGVFATEVMLPL